jgi:hypothetical protein
MSQRNISIPKVSRVAAPSLHVIALDDGGMGKLPRRSYAATFVVADSSRMAVIASAESRT